MSPFIKFTVKIDSPKPTTSYVYVNVAHLVEATYYPEHRHLHILVDTPGASVPHTHHMLYGEEAEAALKTLEELP